MNAIANPRSYYGVRTGADPKAAALDLDRLKDLVLATYKQLSSKGYWDEAFGFWCVDVDQRFAGTAGEDLENYVFMATHKELWPIDSLTLYGYSEADLFTMIELLFDNVSKPIGGQMHDHGNCGMHWDQFDREAGRDEFRGHMCRLLKIYGPGYELNARGEIMELGPKGLSNLLKAKPPISDNDLLGRMNSAIDRYRRYSSSIDDRRHAVHDLADVLEKLRPQMDGVINKKDEGDIFNIANNFGIRHFNEKQKMDYDPVWLSWMFYHFLSMIYVCTHRLKKKQQE